MARLRIATLRNAAALGAALGLLQAYVVLAGDAPKKVSFYFAAHQDDWQLFMSPSAYADVSDDRTKAVFVHLTAGDGGMGRYSGDRVRQHPFFAARENGVEAALRFMTDDTKQPTGKTADLVTVNGHSIHRVSYRNTVAYFLRLPDGDIPGTGFRRTGYQSLKRLQEGSIDTFTAIDDSTVYRGWDDLVSTLHALVEAERGGAPEVQLNVPELDSHINPKDHSDHVMTGRAALEATKHLACARRLHFVNYASAKLPENLTVQERTIEASIFAVTTAGVRAFDHASPWRHYGVYLGRNYFRTEEGKGRCEAPARNDATSQAKTRAPAKVNTTAN
ncbi:MAG: hypothetical protein AB7K04_12640 [Pseudorhodoplanes sp.]